MGPSPARAADDAAPLTAPRARVLESLQRHGGPVTTAELATESGLHENTVREHLDALVARGLAVRGLAPAAGRGRPPVTYSAAALREPDARVREYSALASVLAGHLARTSADPAADARAAGEEWAAALHLEGEPAPSEAQRRARIVKLFSDLGFDPEPDENASSLALRRCPLLDSAVKHPGVICGVHLGLTRGVVERLGGDPDQVALRPFSEPGACRLVLGHTGGKGQAPSGVPAADAE